MYCAEFKSECPFIKSYFGACSQIALYHPDCVNYFNNNGDKFMTHNKDYPYTKKEMKQIREDVAKAVRDNIKCKDSEDCPFCQQELELHAIDVSETKVLEIHKEKSIDIVITWDGKGKMIMKITNDAQGMGIISYMGGRSE